MIIANADLFGKRVTVETENEIIKTVKPFNENDLKTACINMDGKKIIPGLIDTHTHGIMGIDTMDGKIEELSKIYASFGTTAFLPTTMTVSKEDIKAITNKNYNCSAAKMLGFHLEGPYISVNKKGAQKEEYIKNPNIDEFNEFNAFGNVKKITVAPEKEDGIKFIKEISKSAVVSLGHTDCDYETAKEAFISGAKCLTHTFNAMPPLHHRNPGPIGAAIENETYAEVISDGFHVAKPLVLMLYKTFGADRLVLISDSIRPAKCKDGEYMAGGQKVILKNNEARLLDGTIAGSTSTLFECVKKAVSFGIPFCDAVKMASETPAKMLGLKLGKIEEGYPADILLLDENDNIEKVIINGKTM